MGSMNKALVYLFDINSKDSRYSLIKRCAKAYLQTYDLNEYDFTILKDTKGKPYFKDVPLFFNLSHSLKYWVLAISDQPIGIDVQNKRNNKALAIAQRFFHSQEAKLITEHEDMFFDIWSAKESYVKYHGWGIDDHFKDFSVVDGDHIKKMIDNVYLHHLTSDDDYSLCVATKSSSCELIDMRIKLHTLSQDNQTEALTLIKEYVTELNVDLSFQALTNELDNLLNIYGLPKGYFCLAYINEIAVGCVGIKPITDQIGELKRLYVKPTYRGYHVASQLMTSALDHAKVMAYDRLYLDTLSSLHEAIALYEKIGFERMPAYYDNPLPNVIYYQIKL